MILLGRRVRDVSGDETNEFRGRLVNHARGLRSRIAQRIQNRRAEGGCRYALFEPLEHVGIQPATQSDVAIHRQDGLDVRVHEDKGRTSCEAAIRIFKHAPVGPLLNGAAFRESRAPGEEVRPHIVQLSAASFVVAQGVLSAADLLPKFLLLVTLEHVYALLGDFGY